MREACELFNEIDTLNSKASAIVDLLNGAHVSDYQSGSGTVNWACLIVNDLLEEANKKTEELYALLK